MKILISDLTDYLHSLPEDNEIKTYLNCCEFEGEPEYTLNHFLHGDLNFAIANALLKDGSMILLTNDAIDLIGDPDTILAILKTLGELNDEQMAQMGDEYLEYYDGGDDMDYAFMMPSMTGDLIKSYLVNKLGLKLEN